MPRRIDVVQWLHSETVAREKQRAIARIPHCQRPHPVEPGQAPVTPLGIRRQNHLGIRAAAKPVAKTFEFCSELSEVVDFAVKHERKSPIGCAHRLVAERRQLENSEPTKTQCQLEGFAEIALESGQVQLWTVRAAAVDVSLCSGHHPQEVSFVIWAAMAEHVRSLSNGGQVERLLADVPTAVDSAHENLSLYPFSSKPVFSRRQLQRRTYAFLSRSIRIGLSTVR
jgi:hypothetical protein